MLLRSISQSKFFQRRSRDTSHDPGREALICSTLIDMTAVTAAEHEAVLAYSSASSTYRMRPEPVSGLPFVNGPLGEFYISLASEIDTMVADARARLEGSEGDDEASAVARSLVESRGDGLDVLKRYPSVDRVLYHAAIHLGEVLKLPLGVLSTLKKLPPAGTAYEDFQRRYEGLASCVKQIVQCLDNFSFVCKASVILRRDDVDAGKINFLLEEAMKSSDSNAFVTAAVV